MNRSNHLGFASKVWLLSVFLSPFLITIGMSLMGGLRSVEIGDLALFMIPIGFIFSIPNWLLLVIATWLINKSEIPDSEKKGILIFISIILTVILFSIVFGSAFGELWYISFGYFITLIIGILSFKLVPPDKNFQKKEIIKGKLLEDILDDEIY